MFKVTGEIDGTVYDVEVTGDAAAPIVGSKRVRALLDQWQGRSVRLSPTGPVFTVQPGDERSLLALLLTTTRVSRIGEGAPRLAGVRGYDRVS